MLQTTIRVFAGQKLWPSAHQQIDGRQRTGHQHVACNHGAGADLTSGHQPSAHRQAHRLLGVAHKLAHRRHRTDFVLRSARHHQGLVLLGFPALVQAALHAHGTQHLDVAQLRLQKVLGIGLRQCCDRLGFLCSGMALPSDQALHHRKQRGHRTQPRVQHEQHRQINRNPWHVKKGKHAVARHELAQHRQVAKGLGRAGFCGVQVRQKARLEHPLAQRLVELDARAHQQNGTGPFGKRHHAKQEQSQQRHHHQRHVALAHHHAVKHLKHVDRGRQHQQVHHHAEHTHHQKLAAKRPQHFRQAAQFDRFFWVHHFFLTRLATQLQVPQVPQVPQQRPRASAFASPRRWGHTTAAPHRATPINGQ